jgi:hypothetical protein
MTITVDAFQKVGKTHAFSVTDSATAVPVLLSNYNDLSLYNPSATVTVFVSLHAVSATAKSNCVKPTAGNPQEVITLGKGESRIISAPTKCYCAMIGDAAGPSMVYVTEGRGL